MPTTNSICLSCSCASHCLQYRTSDEPDEVTHGSSAGKKISAVTANPSTCIPVQQPYALASPLFLSAARHSMPSTTIPLSFRKHRFLHDQKVTATHPTNPSSTSLSLKKQLTTSISTYTCNNLSSIKTNNPIPQPSHHPRNHGQQGSVLSQNTSYIDARPVHSVLLSPCVRRKRHVTAPRVPESSQICHGYTDSRMSKKYTLRAVTVPSQWSTCSVCPLVRVVVICCLNRAQSHERHHSLNSVVLLKSLEYMCNHGSLRTCFFSTRLVQLNRY